MQGSTATWHDCYKCRQRRPHLPKCTKLLRDPAAQKLCSESPAMRDVVSPGIYAPQLAWWLNFFPAERFFVIPSSQTRDPRTATQVRCQSAVRCCLV